jgi:hypothetical protein
MLSSPLLGNSDVSSQKETIGATWAYLRRNYQIRGDYTHSIYMYGRGFRLADLKQIAGAAIHFEPTLDRMIKDRGVGASMKRNWCDNPRLRKATPKLTRPDSIAAVEAIVLPGEGLAGIFQERSEAWYRWTFWKEQLGSAVKLSPGSECKTADDVIWWAEFAVNFVEAAMGCENSERLQRHPITYAGLRTFMSGKPSPPGSGWGTTQTVAFRSSRA